uniref:DinB family protein n=1 Tax=Flavobacterium caeni TaxID=490189 RepID=UPI00111311FE
MYCPNRPFRETNCWRLSNTSKKRTVNFGPRTWILKNDGSKPTKSRCMDCAPALVQQYSVTEIMFYNLRHLQHHAGQLNLLLRQHGQTPCDWVAARP